MRSEQFIALFETFYTQIFATLESTFYEAQSLALIELL